MAARQSAPKTGRPEEICRKYGLPLTAQRRVILEELSLRADHPTADQVFSRVRRQLPEISRTTVYRVLELLVRLGIARKVCHPGAAARYEMRIGRHHHLVCLACESMVDLECPALNSLPLPDVSSGFKIEDYSIQFRGLCPACARKSPVRRDKRSK
jgi:Fe2+ or Zn2+ uptake regulation protein